MYSSVELSPTTPAAVAELIDPAALGDYGHPRHNVLLRAAAAANPHTGKATLKRLRTDPSPLVRAALAARGTADPQQSAPRKIDASPTPTAVAKLTDPIALGQCALLHHSAAVRTAVAANPHTGKATLKRLRADPSPLVRAMLAARDAGDSKAPLKKSNAPAPPTPESVAKLTDPVDIGPYAHLRHGVPVRAAVAANPHTGRLTLLRLRTDPSPLVQAALVARDAAPTPQPTPPKATTPENIEKLTSVPTAPQILPVASPIRALDPTAWGLALDALATSPVPAVRLAVACDRGALPKTLEVLANDGDRTVRAAARAHPNCPHLSSHPHSAYLPASDDPEHPVCPATRAVGTTPSTTEPAHLGTAPRCLPADFGADLPEGGGLTATELRWQLTAASSQRTPLQVLIGLAANSNDFVRQAVAENPACPEQVLLRLCADPDPVVRQLVAVHAHCPPKALAYLIADRHDAVHRALLGRGKPLSPPSPWGAIYLLVCVDADTGRKPQGVPTYPLAARGIRS